MANLVRKMLSRILYIFLNFVTCCGLGSCGNLSQARGKNDQEVEGDIKLDSITDPEEEPSNGAGYSQSGGKSKRRINYEVTVDHNTRVARRWCWFRRNKIAPAFLPVVGEGVANLYTVSPQQNDILDVKPVEIATSNEDIVLDLSNTKDSFSERKNSALALQSFATCARLNANFMRKTAWAQTESKNEGDERCSSASQETAPSRSSISSKITSIAVDAFRNRISDVSAGFVRTHAENDPGTMKGKSSTVPDRKVEKDNWDFKNTKKGVKKLFRSGKLTKRTLSSSKTILSKPVAIQKLEENDSTTFDRDLYMRINKLTISHDTCQSSSHDPFFVQEDLPPLCLSHDQLERG